MTRAAVERRLPIAEPGPSFRFHEQANAPVGVYPPEEVSIDREALDIPSVRVASEPDSDLFGAGLPRDLCKVSIKRSGQNPGVLSEEPVMIVEIKAIEAFSG